MSKSLLYSVSFHVLMIILTAISLPFMKRSPIDLPPIVSVELIQISDKTNIPYAPKVRKIIDKKIKEEKRVVSEQAPPSAKAKEKPDRIPMPEDSDKEKKLVKKKQNPEEIKPEINPAVYAQKIYTLFQGAIFMAHTLEDPQYLTEASKDVDNLLHQIKT